MFGNLFGRRRSEEYPPEQPPVYGCDTLEMYMDNAAWELHLHGLKGRHDEAASLFNSLFDLGGDMAECTQVMVGFPGLAPHALARRDELMAQGIDVDGLCSMAERTRAVNAAIECGAMSDVVTTALRNFDADRR